MSQQGVKMPRTGREARPQGRDSLPQRREVPRSGRSTRSAGTRAAGEIVRKRMNSSFRGSLLATVAGCMLGAAVLSPPAQARHHEYNQRIQRYYGRTSAPIFSTIRAVDARRPTSDIQVS